MTRDSDELHLFWGWKATGEDWVKNREGSLVLGLLRACIKDLQLFMTEADDHPACWSTQDIAVVSADV